MGPGVRSVILGGAGLAGMAARLQGELPLPLIDSVVAGTQVLLQMPRAKPHAASGGAGWSGVAPELLALLTR
jgi:Asp/Glu/hydantoin racemase